MILPGSIGIRHGALSGCIVTFWDVGPQSRCPQELCRRVAFLFPAAFEHGFQIIYQLDSGSHRESKALSARIIPSVSRNEATYDAFCLASR